MIRLWISFVALALAACTSTGNLGPKSTNYNQALDYSVNVTALSNVIRASNREPMIYSRMGSMTYSGSIVAKPSLAVGLGSDANKDLISFGTDFTDGGNVVFDALVGEKFYRSILTSIEPDLVAYYRDQGWPDRILFSLFVERLEFTEDLGKDVWKALGMPDRAGYCNDFEEENCPIEMAGDVTVFDNDPDKPSAFLLFMRLIEVISNNFVIELDSDPGDARFPARYCRHADGNPEKVTSRTAGSAGSDWTAADEALWRDACQRLSGYDYAFALSDIDRLDLNGLPEGYKIENGLVFQKLAARKPGVKFKLRNTATSGGSVETGDALIAIAQKTQGCLAAVSDTTEAAENSGGGNEPIRVEADKAPADGGASGSTTKPNQPKCTLSIVLRSPNAMLYYLGELHRAQRDANNPTKRLSQSNIDSKQPGKWPKDYIGLCNYQYLEKPKPTRLDTLAFGPDQEFAFGYKHTCSTLESHASDVEEKRRDDSLFRIEGGPNIPGGLSRIRHARDSFSFELEGKRYWISSDAQRRGRTLQYITLIHEVFNLKQEASDAPTVSLLQGVTVQ